MSEPLAAVSPSHVALKIPSHRRHKASGQAVVTLAGHDVYLGTYGSEVSKAEYRRRVAEYLASNGAPPSRRPLLKVSRRAVATLQQKDPGCFPTARRRTGHGVAAPGCHGAQARNRTGR